MASPLMRASFPTQGHDHERCVLEALDKAARLCAARNVRLTPMRRRVLEMIWGQHGPVLAYDLLERLRLEGARAAPPTVYRALTFLSENGLVHRIESLNAYVGCTVPEADHSGQFLICKRCQAVAELADTDITGILAQKAGAIGFRTERQTVELEGLCPSCGGSRRRAAPAR